MYVRYVSGDRGHKILGDVQIKILPTELLVLVLTPHSAYTNSSAERNSVYISHQIMRLAV